MSFDVSGLAPTSPEGEHFYRSVWDWRPIVTYLTTTWPHVATTDPRWHTNDGWGLPANDAKRLAALMQFAIQDGSAAQYVIDRDKTIANLPDEICNICNGTGRRGLLPCNVCDSHGVRRPRATMYSLELEDIRQFAAFLASSGGFKID